MAEGADFSAEGFKSALSSTQGKIAIVSGVAVVGWWWYRNKSGSSSSTASTATSSGVADTSAMGGVDTPSGSGGYTYDGSGGNVGNGNVTTDQSGIPTNATWFQNAENYLEGLGYDAQTAASALGAYLGGQSLTTAQQGLVSVALGSQGQPPTQVPIATGTTATNPSGGTTTVTSGGSTTATGGGSTTHTVTVQKGQTQKELIQAAGETYSQFLTDNPTLGSNGKSNGKKITAGEKITLR